MKLIRQLLLVPLACFGISSQATETAASGDSSLIFSVFDSYLNIGVYFDTGFKFSDIVTSQTFIPNTVNPDQIATFDKSVFQIYDINQQLDNAGFDSVASIFSASNPSDIQWNLVAADATQIDPPVGTILGPPSAPQVGLSLLTTINRPFIGSSINLEISIQNFDELISLNIPDTITVVTDADPRNPAFNGNYSNNFGQPGLVDNAFDIGESTLLTLLTTDAVFLGSNSGFDFFVGFDNLDPNVYLAPTLVTFDGATLQIGYIPVPHAVWLFGSAILSLIGINRKTREQLFTSMK